MKTVILTMALIALLGTMSLILITGYEAIKQIRKNKRE